MAGKEPSPGVIEAAYEFLIRCNLAKEGLEPVGLQIIKKDKSELEGGKGA